MSPSRGHECTWRLPSVTPRNQSSTRGSTCVAGWGGARPGAAGQGPGCLRRGLPGEPALRVQCSRSSGLAGSQDWTGHPPGLVTTSEGHIHSEPRGHRASVHGQDAARLTALWESRGVPGRGPDRGHVVRQWLRSNPQSLRTRLMCGREAEEEAGDR